MQPQKRLEVVDVSSLRIQSYGYNNLYPQHIAGIVAASGTASLCLDRYKKFVEGFGFKDETLASYVVGRGGRTADDLLHSVADDLTKFNGFAIHVNYNVLGEIVELNPVPFEQCRLEFEDEHGFVSHICTHPDWSGKLKRRGKAVPVTNENIKRWPIFDPRPEVVQAQMEAVGGIDYYHGQMLWVSMEGENQYPIPIYDPAVTEISTDEGLGNVKYRNVRSNFLVSSMMITKAGAPDIDRHGAGMVDGGIRTEDLEQFQGDVRAGQIMLVEVEDMEDAPQIREFPHHNFDKDFSTTDETTTERIYAQFHQELFHAIRIGKLGFSGQVMRDAYEYYAGEVTHEQRFIERVFERIFRSWAGTSFEDFTIAPLKYINSEENGIE